MLQENHSPISSCFSIRCIAVIIFMLIASLTAAVIFLSIDDERDATREEDPIKKYRECFRTPKEQKEYQRAFFSHYDNLIPATVYIDPDRKGCSFGCSNADGHNGSQTTAQTQTSTLSQSDNNNINNNNTNNNNTTTNNNNNTNNNTVPESTVSPPMTGRRKRQALSFARTVFHACCVSQLEFLKPHEAFNMYGEKLTVIQSKALGQYFKSYRCSHAKGCTGCGCYQSRDLHQAVVHYPDNKANYFLEIIVLPGCCKCYNNLSPP